MKLLSIFTAAFIFSGQVATSGALVTPFARMLNCLAVSACDENSVCKDKRYETRLLVSYQVGGKLGNAGFVFWAESEYGDDQFEPVPSVEDVEFDLADWQKDKYRVDHWTWQKLFVTSSDDTGDGSIRIILYERQEIKDTQYTRTDLNCYAEGAG